MMLFFITVFVRCEEERSAYKIILYQHSVGCLGIFWDLTKPQELD